MTKKLYWEDAYRFEFDATVTTIESTKVVLDQTCFNPQGGGLVSDIGQLNGIRVNEVRYGENDAIIHILAQEPAFKIKDQAHGVVDWSRRHRIMRMHTSAHLLSAIFHREADALITGNRIEPERSRIDFSLAEFDRARVESYVQQANAIIAEGRVVKTYFLPREKALQIPGIVKLAGAFPPEVEELRIVEIEGVDIQADGGPHVRELREIGQITIEKLENKGAQNRRLYYNIS